MNQIEVLKKVIDEVGGISNLSLKTGIPAPHFYSWLKGSEIRFNKLVVICEAAGYEFVLSKKETKVNYPSDKCDEVCYYHCTKGGQQSPECLNKNEKKQDCDCTIVNGLLRRGKSKCKKTKEEHSFL